MSEASHKFFCPECKPLHVLFFSTPHAQLKRCIVYTVYCLMVTFNEIPRCRVICWNCVSGRKQVTPGSWNLHFPQKIVIILSLIAATRPAQLPIVPFTFVQKICHVPKANCDSISPWCAKCAVICKYLSVNNYFIRTFLFISNPFYILMSICATIRKYLE